MFREPSLPPCQQAPSAAPSSTRTSATRSAASGASSSPAGSGSSAALSRPPASTSERSSPVASLPDSRLDSARLLLPSTKLRSLARPFAAALLPHSSLLSRSPNSFNTLFPLDARTLRTTPRSGCLGPFKPSRASSSASSCLPSLSHRAGSWITAGRSRRFRSSPTFTPRETRRTSSSSSSTSRSSDRSNSTGRWPPGATSTCSSQSTSAGPSSPASRRCGRS
ncbi:hypothetical protein AAT19DRAFT_9846 [Rhodotorula toruloides]|uniref:Uncharacterized protein n=1 Tax=Rhodotorula toruloides TaxID=5286 RepID=A0A2T0A167_RHOTO|nr:hypothetical protein AAT19DRAFT_9846 [Rhodotorula toruloides]